MWQYTFWHEYLHVHKFCQTVDVQDVDVHSKKHLQTLRYIKGMIINNLECTF